MRILQKYLASRFYGKDNRARNWYRDKGYVGETDQQIFQDFLSKQQEYHMPLHSYFKDINASRVLLQKPDFKIDVCYLEPADIQEINNSNKKVIISLLGKNEYYEARFKDMTLLAKASKCAVIGFNYRGINSSQGKVLTLKDLAKDALSVLEHVLQIGFKAENIIMLGNSLGAGVQEMVLSKIDKLYPQHGYKNKIRLINSNSFSSLAEVASHGKSFMMRIFIHLLLNIAGWEVKVTNDFFIIGKLRMYLWRESDLTIPPSISYVSKVDMHKSLSCSDPHFKDKLLWLVKNSQLELNWPEKHIAKMAGSNIINSHNFSLYHFRSKFDKKYNAFDLISIFINDEPGLPKQ